MAEDKLWGLWVDVREHLSWRVVAWCSTQWLEAATKGDGVGGTGSSPVALQGAHVSIIVKL